LVEPTAVLDASALLAYLHHEPGYQPVVESLAQGVAISAVNWAEVLTKLSDIGLDAEGIASELTTGGLVGGSLQILPFDEPLARRAARLRSATRTLGLSLGDRACLALGQLLGVPVLTADRSWQSLRAGVKLRLIR
jgi:ribonuclease VapC